MNKYHVTLTSKASDVKIAQAFRGKIFRGGELDCDPLDEMAIHGIIRNQQKKVVCVFRMLTVENEGFDGCYSAQFYDLNQIKAKHVRALELGRFCVHPDYNDPNIIRLAWAELTEFVLKNDIELLFGCSSFQGADAETHADALALLQKKHLAPKSFMPCIKSPKVFRFAEKLKQRVIDIRLANKNMPPLLRTYLAMGGWVSDHAVVDDDLNTVHVFTGVEIRNIPNNRLRMLTSLLPRVKA